jgi:uncharacterized RDD family membrane protein YckC
MSIKLLEPTPERRRDVAESGVTPRVLLRRWAFMLYAVLKLLLGLMAVGVAYLILYGLLVTQPGLLSGSVAGFLFLVGMIPVAKLYHAWAFPVRY